MTVRQCDPKGSRLLSILMGALLLGFAWQIRGSGTSDPSVVAMLFLLFLSAHYGPKKKFGVLSFGLIAFLFNLMRTGWGTFVPQAGIPGVIPGHLVYPPHADIAVPWWSGYFWLLIVGIAWFGVPSLVFGGYLFTKQRYTRRDVFVILILFVVTRIVAGFVAEALIPLLAPTYYREIYLTGISDRSYGSMRGNMATAIAVIPVLFYIHFTKKDRDFCKHSFVAMAAFAVALSIADVWRPLSFVLGIGTSVAWGLWEYSTGFIFGGLFFWYLSRFTNAQLEAADLPVEFDTSRWNRFGTFLLYGTALYRLVLYGIAEGLEGSIRKSLMTVDIVYSPDPDTLKLVTGISGLTLYWFYFHGKIGTRFAELPFHRKSLLALTVLLPFHYLNYSLHRILSGTLFVRDWNSSEVWLDSVSFAMVETYLICLVIHSDIFHRTSQMKPTLARSSG